MSRRLPFASLSIVTVSLAVYVMELTSDGLAICERWGFAPARFLDSGNVSSAIGYAALHDPREPLHLVGNLALLGIFGPLVERRLGAMRMLAVYIAGAIAGALGHLALAPDAPEPLVGGSGAVFALLALASVIEPRLLAFATLLFGANLLALVRPTPWLVPESTSVGCHIGGFAVGAAIVFVARARRVPWANALTHLDQTPHWRSAP